MAIYAFLTAWSEVLFASVMTNGSTRTLAVGRLDYSTQTGIYWNQIMAASLVVSVPVAGFLIMQRFPCERPHHLRRQVNPDTTTERQPMNEFSWVPAA